MDTITKLARLNNFIYKCESWIGIEIMTTNQTIRVMVDDFQICCENFDVVLLMPEPDGRIFSASGALNLPEELIGAAVEHVGWSGKLSADEFSHVKQYLGLYYTEEFNAVVEIKTDRGPIKLIAYNDNNGYYPHNVLVEWAGHSEIQQINLYAD